MLQNKYAKSYYLDLNLINDHKHYYLKMFLFDSYILIGS